MEGNDAVTRHCRHKHELDDHPTQAPKGFCLTNYVRRMLSLRDMTSKDRICYLLLVCLLANSQFGPFGITEMLSFFETSSLVQSMSLKKLSLNRGDGLKLNTNAFNLPIMNGILNLSYAFCRLHNSRLVV
ncbi:hypothetical protein JHK87_001238 [Glycine soja]|nr:hypothetical protein JHK87_001238 [Glycine soja]